MQYAVRQADGTFTGVVYQEPAAHVLAHHAQYGEALVPVFALHNLGTDRAPDWQSAPVPPEEAEGFFARAIDAHIEAQARALRYNSAAHLAGYASSTVPAWAAEAAAFIAWRDACWIAALALLAQATTSGEVPTLEDVLAALPEWVAP